MALIEQNMEEKPVFFAGCFIKRSPCYGWIELIYGQYILDIISGPTLSEF